jgi:hypothetical protein
VSETERERERPRERRERSREESSETEVNEQGADLLQDLLELGFGVVKVEMFLWAEADCHSRVS